MRALFLLLATLTVARSEPGGRLPEWLNPELARIAARRATLERELAALGTPVVGQTVEQFGYQHPRTPAAPLNPAWVQIDLGAPQPLGWIALIPAQLDWQSFDRPAYGFPRRFRIDLADEPEFRRPIAVADFTESDFPDPGVAPVGVHLVVPQTARYLRVTVTKFALENDQHFFALAEILALSGSRNLAIGRPVTVSGHYELPPRWSPANLVDGRTPLGPPIRRELIAYDGLFADAPVAGGAPFFSVDLGSVRDVQEIRLHPVHARIGADVPGFKFPKKFRVEAADDAEFTAPRLLFAGVDFPNPGNNPITLPTPDCRARAIRVVVAEAIDPAATRFGLSELEVYSSGVNVARGGRVLRSPDRSTFSSHWPDTVLIDGFTSYGRLVELPEWLDSWSRRRAAQGEWAALTREEAVAVELAARRGWRVFTFALCAAAAAAIAFTIRSRRRRRSDIEQLRLRLARDLHDEIGSNLASLAVTGEVAAASAPADQRDDWAEVTRVSRESMDSMREVLWVLGAREEAGLDLAARLQRTAQRMLARQEIVWISPPENPPAGWDPAARREIFLFFKEVLANVIRHAEARRVTLRAGCVDRTYQLEIHDDGRGFDPGKATAGLGVKSLRERARTLRGKLELHSAPGDGTCVTLSVPL